MWVPIQNFSSIGQEIKNLRNKWHSVVVDILAVFMVTKNKWSELLGYVSIELVRVHYSILIPHMTYFSDYKLQDATCLDAMDGCCMLLHTAEHFRIFHNLTNFLWKWLLFIYSKISLGDSIIKESWLPKNLEMTNYLIFEM